MKTLLFNPFRYIAGLEALVVGVASMLLTSIIAHFSGTHFDGTIDIHFAATEFTYSLFAFQQVIAWLTAALFFYVLGVILSKSNIRLVDILGTTAMARSILLPVALVGFLPGIKITDVSQISLLAIVGALITVLFGIWLVALLYSAFKVSCNLKGAKATWGFIIALVLAEILSKVLNYQLLKYFA